MSDSLTVLKLFLEDHRTLAFTPAESGGRGSINELVSGWRQMFNQNVLVFADKQEMVCVPSKTICRMELHGEIDPDALAKIFSIEGNRVIHEITPETFVEIEQRNKKMETSASSETGKETSFLLQVTISGGDDIFLECWIQQLGTAVDQRKNLMAVFESSFFSYRTVSNGLGLLNPFHIDTLRFSCGAPAVPSTSYALKQVAPDI